MSRFLLQTVDGEIRQDFVFTMVDALDYQKWLGNDMSSKRCELRDLNAYFEEQYPDVKNWIPVGTIEFVMTFIDKFIKPNGSKEIKPLNVPESLFDYPYAGRHIDNFEISQHTRQHVFNIIDDWSYDNMVFIKSNDIIKSSLNDFYNKEEVLNYNTIPDGNYQISEFVNIESEWRCFIYKGELVGIQYYSGDFTKYPNIESINEMINQIITQENQNAGLTLDVAVTKDNKTIVMEAHDFFSCGLYGFNDYSVLPYMFLRTFNNIKNKLLTN